MVALTALDLDLPAGSLFSLLGPSGCGKTTLLRCIAGLERPTSGTLMIGHRDVTAGRGVPAERRRVGMVFQDGALFPHRTVLDNVSYGIPRGPDRRDRALAALRLVGLDDKGARMPGALSGGEQQRVALARALAPGPSVVLLDEPFSSLDAALRVQLRDEVRRLLTGVGMTAILVTHDQEEALSVSDRVALMNAGRLVQRGTPEELYRRPRDSLCRAVRRRRLAHRRYPWGAAGGRCRSQDRQHPLQNQSSRGGCGGTCHAAAEAGGSHRGGPGCRAG